MLLFNVRLKTEEVLRMIHTVALQKHSQIWKVLMNMELPLVISLVQESKGFSGTESLIIFPFLLVIWRWILKPVETNCLWNILNKNFFYFNISHNRFEMVSKLWICSVYTKEVYFIWWKIIMIFETLLNIYTKKNS